MTERFTGLNLATIPCFAKVTVFGPSIRGSRLGKNARTCNATTAVDCCSRRRSQESLRSAAAWLQEWDGGIAYEQLVDKDGTLILQLHDWDAHEHPCEESATTPTTLHCTVRGAAKNTKMEIAYTHIVMIPG